ncbi:alpha/beta hydrolase family protein [Oleiharenicola sp. Vm1]|uniref:alpha/beta hydrolase family protein n=1 Tax=Oleiharenicola sp. Vm1 TaxID=3398393 RepID=UPI0039F61545
MGGGAGHRRSGATRHHGRQLRRLCRAARAHARARSIQGRRLDVRPSDLPRQLEHYRADPEHAAAYAYWSQRVGDAEKDRAWLEAASPVHAVAKIRAPLFIVYGDNDPRIPYAQSADFVRALRAAKKDFVRYAPEGEGHGIADEQARIKIYQALDAFLAARFPAN